MFPSPPFLLEIEQSHGVIEKKAVDLLDKKSATETKIKESFRHGVCVLLTTKRSSKEWL